jgi:hypothetical protein
MDLLGGGQILSLGGQLPPPPRYIVKKGTALNVIIISRFLSMFSIGSQPKRSKISLYLFSLLDT